MVCGARRWPGSAATPRDIARSQDAATLPRGRGVSRARPAWPSAHRTCAPRTTPRRPRCARPPSRRSPDALSATGRRAARPTRKKHPCRCGGSSARPTILDPRFPMFNSVHNVRAMTQVLLQDVATPSFLVDRDIVLRNCDAMREKARLSGVAFRPHVKTHKSVAIGRMQHGGAAGPITVSTLAEAEQFAADGFRDITYAFP